MDKLAKIDELLNEADKLALEWVEEKGRQILKKCSRLEEFIMGMGSVYFTAAKPFPSKTMGDYEAGAIIDPDDLPTSAQGFIDDIEGLDQFLGLMGYHMRFTAEGPKVTDW